jgi:hypothetical protein
MTINNNEYDSVPPVLNYEAVPPGTQQVDHMYGSAPPMVVDAIDGGEYMAAPPPAQLTSSSGRAHPV